MVAALNAAEQLDSGQSHEVLRPPAVPHCRPGSGTAPVSGGALLEMTSLGATAAT